MCQTANRLTVFPFAELHGRLLSHWTTTDGRVNAVVWADSAGGSRSWRWAADGYYIKQLSTAARSVVFALEARFERESMRVWRIDLELDRCELIHSNHIASHAAITGLDAQRVAMVAHIGDTRLMMLDSGKVTHSLSLTPGKSVGRQYAARCALCAHLDRVLVHLAFGRGSVTLELKFDNGWAKRREISFEGATSIDAMAYFDDGERIAILGEAGRITIHRSDSGDLDADAPVVEGARDFWSASLHGADGALRVLRHTRAGLTLLI